MTSKDTKTFIQLQNQVATWMTTSRHGLIAIPYNILRGMIVVFYKLRLL